MRTEAPTALVPFTAQRIADLVAESHPGTVTLAMPALVDRDARQDPVRLRNLLDEAERLLAAEGLDEAAIGARLDAARALGRDIGWWRDVSPGIALVLTADGMRAFRLPEAVPETVSVQPFVDVRPFLPLTTPDAAFHVLCLDPEGCRLFAGSRHALAEVPLPGAPRSIDDLGWTDGLERHVRSGGASGGGALGFGFSNKGYDIDKLPQERLREYFRLVDAEVAAATGPNPPPLVLCGLELEIPLYRQSSRHRDLLGTPIAAHPQAILREGTEALRRRAWERLQPRLARALALEADRCRARLPKGLAAAGIAATLRACGERRVETLLLAHGSARFGLDGATPAVVDGHAARAVDLHAYAARETLRSGGRVLMLEPDLVPAPDGIAAILRW